MIQCKNVSALLFACLLCLQFVMTTTSLPATRYTVPWWDRNEWCQIKNDLLSSDNGRRRHSLRRILAWKSRTGFKLAKAIECTADLVSATLDDEEVKAKGASGHHAVSMSYSMAIIRFVNLLTESLQSKQYAAPVHLLAQELGLPTWLVDLRHDATHSHMPALPLLRAGAQKAIAWLKKEYWDVTDTSTNEEEESDAGTELYIQDTLVIYQQEQFKFLKDSDQTSSTKKDKTVITNLLLELQQLKSKDRKCLVHWLVQPGYLVCTEDQLEALDISVTDTLDLPDEVVKFWWPIVKTLTHIQSLPYLIEQLTNKLTDGSSLTNQMVAGWIGRLATATSNDENVRGKYTLRAPAGLLWTGPVKKCAMEPCDLTYKLLKRILKYHPSVIEKEDQSKLLSMMDLYLGRTNLKYTDNQSQLESVKSLFGDQGEDKDPAMEIEPPKGGTAILETRIYTPWQIYDGPITWSSIPLGDVVGVEEISHSTLELPDFVRQENFRTLEDDGSLSMEYPSSLNTGMVSQQMGGHSISNGWSEGQVKQLMTKVHLF